MVGRGLDVRPLVDASDVGEYAAGRILASYDDVEKFVAPCTDLRRDSALDVGCGAGLETFALGSHFERVVGVDPDAKAIAAAQRLAGRAGTDRVDFRPTTIEAFETRDKYSFVLCNVMSHNLPSRRVLLARLRRLARPGAWLAYAEQTEGYPLLEIANALQARNARALEERIRQVFNGFLCRSGFRFFVAGTSSPALALSGFEVAKASRRWWRSFPYLERVWARVALDEGSRTQPYLHGDPDYVAPPPDFEEARACFRGLGGRGAGLVVSELRARAAAAQNRFAPFLLVAAMASFVPGSTEPRRSLGRKVVGKALPRRVDRLDWHALDDLHNDLVELLERRPPSRARPSPTSRALGRPY